MTTYESSFFYTEPVLVEMVKKLVLMLDEEYGKLKEIRKMCRNIDRCLWKQNLLAVFEFSTLIDKIGSLELMKQKIFSISEAGSQSLSRSNKGLKSIDQDRRVELVEA